MIISAIYHGLFRRIRTTLNLRAQSSQYNTESTHPLRWESRTLAVTPALVISSYVLDVVTNGVEIVGVLKFCVHTQAKKKERKLDVEEIGHISCG